MIASALSLEPSFDPAFSNSLMSLTASVLEDLDSTTLLAEALMSAMSREGMTKSLMRLRDVLDLLIVSIIDAISLLKATYCESALSLCSIISFFLLSCSFNERIYLSSSDSRLDILLSLSSRF